MPGEEHRSTSIFDTNLRITAIGFFLLILLSTTITAAPAAGAQTFSVLHDFTNGLDGGEPQAGLSMDRAGNFYGTASTGGNTSGACSNRNPHGCGTVFKLSRRGSDWVFTTLYTFSGPDGANPLARVIVGPDGSLYGTTSAGGSADQGTVFNLRPPLVPCKTTSCPWKETVLYNFHGSDGGQPTFGDLVFDAAGNIYGTTPRAGNGMVYKLTRSTGGWTETILYTFHGGNDGAIPYAGLTFDHFGNLWGATAFGGIYNDGTIYELVPSGGGWAENVVYVFHGGNDGANPYGGLIVDQSGNFYGTTFGANGSPVEVYELSPSSGGWTFNTLYTFSHNQGIIGKLAMDAAGNLYGTNYYDVPEVFRLTPSNGGWTLTGSWGGVGDNPCGNVTFDGSGNLYTTTQGGGSGEVGLVFEITP